MNDAADPDSVPEGARDASTTVFTIGHSTHPIDEFVLMLRNNGVDHVVDVRTVRGSRHNPQFGDAELARSLPEHGIRYSRIERLGGLRHSRVGEASINGAWRNASFRSYADYMQTDEFRKGIDELISDAEHGSVAIMCAEAVPWRCHRSLIGDALLVRGIPVIDIMSPTSSKPHALTSFAKTEGERVWYPPEDEDQRQHESNDDDNGNGHGNGNGHAAGDGERNPA